MNANLIFERNSLAIKNVLYDDYYISFDLEIHSGVFSGIAPCDYEYPRFCKFVSELSKMYDLKRTSVTFNDSCYGSTVDFTMDKKGQIKISGEIYGESMEHSMKFNFFADQTVLKSFIKELELLIA